MSKRKSEIGSAPQTRRQPPPMTPRIKWPKRASIASQAADANAWWNKWPTASTPRKHVEHMRRVQDVLRAKKRDGGKSRIDRQLAYVESWLARTVTNAWSTAKTETVVRSSSDVTAALVARSEQPREQSIREGIAYPSQADVDVVVLEVKSKPIDRTASEETIAVRCGLVRPASDDAVILAAAVVLRRMINRVVTLNGEVDRDTEQVMRVLDERARQIRRARGRFPW